MKKKLFILILFTALVSNIYAQQRTISGQVTDADSNSAIPGVSVILKGTAQGIMTDFEGKYSLTVNEGNNIILSFSYFGYVTQEINVGDKSVINVELKTETAELDEVIVTALGIKREKKALGYSASEIGGNDLTEARETNILNSISGKIAGVQISKTAGGAGGSSRVVIRGNSSISGNNQALIVVDGIPIDNTNYQSAGWLGGHDYGDGISDLNPDDIESITVLKGPNAAALYGSKAANGVIMITTKKGTVKKGIGVSVNMSTTVDIADIQADYQNEYGLGGNGYIPRIALDSIQRLMYPGWDTIEYSPNSYQSWGPKMDGRLILNWNGEIRPYEPHPDNVKNYYERGITSVNSFAINSGSEKATFRMSYTNLYNKGLRPNSWYKKNSITLRGTSKLTKKINIDAKVNYDRNDAFNRPGQGDSRSGARTFIWMPRNIDINKLRDDYKDAYGYEQNYYKSDSWHTNPYWESYENTNNDTRDRILGTVKSDFQITDWLSLMLRTGTDFHTDRRFRRIASYSMRAPNGEYSETWIGYRSMNSDFLLTGKKTFGKIDFSLSFGGNNSASKIDISSSTIKGFAVPNFFSLNNYTNKLDNSTGTTVIRKTINSLYGFSQIAYKSYLYIDINARNDWSSSLPSINNSYFYQAISTGFIFSEALKLNSKIISFGKVRLSWAKVGNDADPYMLEPVYLSGSFGELPVNHLNNIKPLYDLKPEITRSWEAGSDLRFFQNKVGIDVSIYKGISVNQILSTEISKATGYNKAVINAGEIQNKGIELLLTIQPIKNKDFSWDININFAKNKSKVISLAEDINTYPITSTSQIIIEARPGDPYGNIVGTYILTDSVSGKHLIDPSTGLYISSGTDTKVLGNINPDWIGGIVNSIKYKAFYLSFTVGVQMGGDIYSKTNRYGNDNGQFVNTLEGRESWYAATEEEQLNGMKADGTPVGYVPEGVFPDGTPNNRGLDPQVYWHQGKWNGITELSIYDASYIKLREMIIGVNIPKSFLKKIKINSASFSLTGRNLWLIYSGVPNIDPESSFTNQNNGLGQEYAAMPTARNIGFSLRFNF